MEWRTGGVVTYFSFQVFSLSSRNSVFVLFSNFLLTSLFVSLCFSFLSLFISFLFFSFFVCFSFCLPWSRVTLTLSSHVDLCALSFKVKRQLLQTTNNKQQTTNRKKQTTHSWYNIITHSIFLSTLCILISFYHSFSNSFVSLLVRSFSVSSLFHLTLICVHSLSRVHIYSYTIVRFQHVIIDVRARPSYSGFGSSFRSW